MIAIVIPILITFFDLYLAEILIIAEFNEKQLNDKNNIIVGKIKEYNDIPCSPNNLVKMILFNNPNALIIKLVINNTIVFFKILFLKFIYFIFNLYVCNK